MVDRQCWVVKNGLLSVAWGPCDLPAPRDVFRGVCRAAGRSWLAVGLAVLFLLGVLCPLAAEEERGEEPTGPQPGSPAAAAVYSDAANFQNNGEFSLAAEEWQKFLKRFPDDPVALQAHQYLGVCLLQSQSFEKAAAEFAAVVKNGTDEEFLEEAYLNLGWCYYSQGLQDQRDLLARAEKIFADTQARFPEGKLGDQALFYRGECLYLLGRSEDAIEQYATLVKKFADSPMRADALYALGVGHQEMQKHAAAGDAFAEFLKTYPNHELSAEVKLRRAETLVEGGDFAAAEAMFGEAAEAPKFASADQALLRQAYCAARQDKFAEAARLYARLVQNYPQSSFVGEATLSAGRAYYRDGDLDQAVRWFDKVRAAGGKSAPEAVHWIARAKLKQKNPAAALKLVEEILPRAEGSAFSAQLRMDLADALYELPGRRAEAQDMYARLAGEEGNETQAPAALYNAAYAALELKQYGKAQRLAEKFLSAHPDHQLEADVQYVAAESALMQGQHELAGQLYRQLLAAHASHEDSQVWHVRLALAQFLQQQFQEVIAELSATVDKLPAGSVRAEALFLIGSSQHRLGRNEEALTSLQAALKTDPTWRQADQALLTLAKVQEALGQPAAAEQSLQRLLSELKDSKLQDRAVFQQAELAYAAGDHARSLRLYDQVLREWPDTEMAPHALYGKGWTLLRTGNPAEAVATLTAMIDRYRDHELWPQAMQARAICRQRLKDYEGGLADIDNFLKTNPDQHARADALYLRGLCQLGLKQYDAARDTLANMLEDFPDYARRDKVLYELAWAAKEQGENSASLEYFARLDQEYPQSPLAAEAQYHAGEARYAEKDYAAAQRAYEQALRTADQRDELAEKSLYKLGWSRFHQADFESALESFQQQSAQFPEGSLADDAQFLIGECLFKLQRYPEALEYYQKLRETADVAPRVAELLLLHGGQSAAQSQQWATAVEWLETIPRKHPESNLLAQAHYELGWARQNLKQLDAARQHYEAAAELSRGEAGARARFMLGEMYFARQDFGRAIREYQRLMYGFGGEAAPAKIKTWQAKGGLEAGRCAALLASRVNDPSQKREHVGRAQKYLRYVMDGHPGTREADAAAHQLKNLGAKLGNAEDKSLR